MITQTFCTVSMIQVQLMFLLLLLWHTLLVLLSLSCSGSIEGPATCQNPRTPQDGISLGILESLNHRFFLLGLTLFLVVFFLLGVSMRFQNIFEAAGPSAFCD